MNSADWTDHKLSKTKLLFQLERCARAKKPERKESPETVSLAEGFGDGASPQKRKTAEPLPVQPNQLRLYQTKATVSVSRVKYRSV